MKKIMISVLMMITGSLQAATVCNINNSTLPTLESVYKSGLFRIYYSKNPASTDYLPDQTDNNSNGVPDYVENVAIQANVTTEALSYLGYVHPLNSERYNGVAEFIDIHLTALNGNGAAFENPSKFVNKPIKENKCSLVLQIRNNLEDFPGTYWTTVTHEIFHLYQYGYTQFKGGWFLEGMTNWAERLLRLGTQGGNSSTLLPATQTQLENNVYNVSYNDLWHRLAVLSDTSTGQLNLPSHLLLATYTDGSKVFKDEKWKGFLFMKKALENLQLKSDQVSILNNRHPHQWVESDQTDPANRPYMLDAIQETMLQYGLNQTTEQQNFLNLN